MITVWLQVPVMSLEGNHEIEPDLHGRMFQAFMHRFRFPAEESDSPSQLFYSFDLAGAWHCILLLLCSPACAAVCLPNWLGGAAIAPMLTMPAQLCC